MFLPRIIRPKPHPFVLKGCGCRNKWSVRLIWYLYLFTNSSVRVFAVLNARQACVWLSPSSTESSSTSNFSNPIHGVSRVEWIIPLMVVSALTFVCLILLLAVLVYWRWDPNCTGSLYPEPPSVWTCLLTGLPFCPAHLGREESPALTSISTLLMFCLLPYCSRAYSATTTLPTPLLQPRLLHYYNLAYSLTAAAPTPLLQLCLLPYCSPTYSHTASCLLHYYNPAYSPTAAPPTPLLHPAHYNTAAPPNPLLHPTHSTTAYFTLQLHFSYTLVLSVFAKYFILAGFPFPCEIETLVSLAEIFNVVTQNYRAFVRGNVFYLEKRKISLWGWSHLGREMEPG